MQSKIDLIKIVSLRLLIGFIFIFIVMSYMIYKSFYDDNFFAPTMFVVMLFGFAGGFVSMQVRLKSMSDFDLELLASSIINTYVPPFVGGVLAILLYIIFLTELIQTPVFPKFVPDADNSKAGTILSVLRTSGPGFSDWAKLIFWSFVSGYSEGFVINIMNKIKSNADVDVKKNNDQN